MTGVVDRGCRWSGGEKGDEGALGSAANGSNDMGLGGEGMAAGQDESGKEWAALGGGTVDGGFKSGDAGSSGKALGMRYADGPSSDGKELLLSGDKESIVGLQGCEEDRVLSKMGTKKAEMGIEFIERADALDSRVGLGGTTVIGQVGLAAVARSSIDHGEGELLEVVDDVVPTLEIRTINDEADCSKVISDLSCRLHEELLPRDLIRLLSVEIEEYQHSAGTELIEDVGGEGKATVNDEEIGRIVEIER